MKRLYISVTILFLTAAAVFSAKPVQTGSVEYDRFGTVIRFPGAGKTIYLAFTADSAFEGAPYALNIMKNRGVKASFFFTGQSLTIPGRKEIVQRIIREGHYVGGHSHNHLLYADWNKERTTLIEGDSIIRDLENNYKALAEFGLNKQTSPWFLPPYEWYNAESVKAVKRFGLKVVNFTPGVWTNEDYTTPDMSCYKSSDCIMNDLYRYERKHSLDGAIMLIHLGTDTSRTDKFYYRIGEIIDDMRARGYRFERLH